MEPQTEIEFSVVDERILAKASVSVMDERGALFLTEKSLYFVTPGSSVDRFKVSVKDISGKR